MSTFADKLRVARGHADMPRSYAADCLGVCDAELERWESGQGFPRSSQLCELSSLYSVSVDWLMCQCPSDWFGYHKVGCGPAKLEAET